MYHLDVLQRLRDARVASTQDIEWLRVLRHYMEVWGKGRRVVGRRDLGGMV